MKNLATKNLATMTAAALLVAVSGTASFAQMNSKTGSSSANSSASASSGASACPDEAAFTNNMKKNGISASERQKVRTTVFDDLDKNKDGMVSRTEYVNCLVETPAFKEKGKGAAAIKK